MKILDKYIVKSFFTTFGSVFIILFFIFILQGIWLFITDLAGKDLDTFLIFKFLAFYAPTIVPLVLPLSVLLASIMTFGSFAENYEFAAMKSSGISLQRAMKWLTIFIVILSLIAFLFANNIIPKAQYKFINLKRTIVQQKPSAAIAEGQFSNVANYTIKVSDKYGENDKLLKDVVIHKISSTGDGATLVIHSKRGELIGNEGSNFLQLVLFDGYYYEDIIPKNYNDRPKVPFAKSSFKKYIINFDLAPLNKIDASGEITNTNVMLNINELSYTIDSLENNYKTEAVAYAENSFQKAKNVLKEIKLAKQNNDKVSTEKNILSLFTTQEQASILTIAYNNFSSMKYGIEGAKYDFEMKRENINGHWIAVYDKFVIAYGCLLMFFIGAPLGAIIRKGGLGLPIVFAVLIFITFHFINVFGKKLAQEDQISPFFGAWMSSIILTPLAVSLTYRATNDIGLFSIDNFLSPVTKKLGKIFKLNNNK